MKKNKQVNDNLPNKVNHEKGSVGEFIELLKQLPSDGKLTLDGKVDVDISNTDKTFEDGNTAVSIYPRINDDAEYDNKEIDSEESVEAAKESFEDYVAGKFYLGFDHSDCGMISTLRSGPADKVLGAPIMTPNTGALEYEENYLLPNQRDMIDEIRHHNVYVAECMAEICRRSVSAILEYNTQIISHFAQSTTKDMCTIVNNGTAGKVLECLEENDEEL